MKIIIDGKDAVLREDIAFEYVRENPLFTNAEDYSMDITFPLEDCPQNISIFGALHVKGVDISTVSFPCEIYAGEFYRAGILVIISVTDSEVRGQFLEGISAQNFRADLDSIYLNDLDFSSWDGRDGGWDDFPDGEYTSGRTAGWIEFPVYDKNKERVIEAVNQGDGRDYLSRHIYLWKLVDLVAAASGWSVNQSVLKRLGMYMHTVVVNTRNFIWNDSGETIRPLELSLPNWSVAEFYNQISMFFGCLVYIDHDKLQVTFRAYSDVAENATKVNLSVLDDFKVEINSKEKPQYRGSRKYKLAAEANPDNINSCSFIEDDLRIPHETMTKSAFLQQVAGMASHSNDERYDGAGWLYHLYDIDEYAAIVKKDDSVTKGYVYVPGTGSYEEDVDMGYPTIVYEEAEILNQFSDIPEDGEELKICPCPLNGPFADFHWGWNIGVQPPMEILKRRRIPSLDIPEDPDDCYDSDVPTYVPDIINRLSSGKREKDDMYFNKLWVVLWEDTAGGPEVWFTRKKEPYCLRKKAEYWRGSVRHVIYDDDGNPVYGEYTEGFSSHNWNLTPYDSSLQTNAALPKVDESKVYRYNFLATSLPDPKAIYIIKGKQYACAKLTVHFTIKGMSEYIEGEFYEIIG